MVCCPLYTPLRHRAATSTAMPWVMLEGVRGEGAERRKSPPGRGSAKWILVVKPALMMDKTRTSFVIAA